MTTKIDVHITATDIGDDGYYAKSRDLIVTGGLSVDVGVWLRVRGRIKAGEGIEAGSGIEAGWDIKAGWGIEAGSGIKAGEGIEAGSDIKAGWGIEAGSGIKAGWDIKAGSGIEAGWGIEAGSGISAKWVGAALRIFAGLCSWRLPTEVECEIRAEVRGGTVAHGTVVAPASAKKGGE